MRSMSPSSERPSIAADPPYDAALGAVSALAALLGALVGGTTSVLA